MRPYSMDLRQRVMWDVDAGLTTQAIAEKYLVSTRWIQQLKRRRAETGEITPRQGKRGPKPRVPRLADQVLELVGKQPDATLRELQAQLPEPVSRTSLWRLLKQLGVTLKKSSARRRTGPARRGAAARRLAAVARAARSAAPGISR